jgi:autotransporter-associated beta strand protein
VVVTNGGRIAGMLGTSSSFLIGRASQVGLTPSNDVVTVTGSDAAGNPSMIDCATNICTVGFSISDPTPGNTVACNNGLVVANGGVVTNLTILRLGNQTGGFDCANNYVLVSGGGKLYITNQLVIGAATRQSSNSVTVTGVGSLIDLNGNIAASQAFIATQAACTNNSLTIANGGAMTGVKYISFSGVNSKLILDDALIRFSTNASIPNVILTNTSVNPVNPLALLKSGGVRFDIPALPTVTTNAFQVAITEDPSSVGGGLTKLGVGILVLADANTYTGNTVISNGTLRLRTPTTLNTNTTVYIVNTNTAAIDLSFTGTNVVKDLYINGVRQPQGVYGANPPGITGTGYLQVSVGAVVAPPALNYTLSGSPGAQSLNFSWTGSFKLQSQTNALTVGLSTNWYDYPGGGSSPVVVPVSSSSASVFFRLSQ